MLIKGLSEFRESELNIEMNNSELLDAAYEQYNGSPSDENIHIKLEENR